MHILFEFHTDLQFKTNSETFSPAKFSLLDFELKIVFFLKHSIHTLKELLLTSWDNSFFLTIEDTMPCKCLLQWE